MYFSSVNVTLFLVVNIKGITWAMTYHKRHFMKGNDEHIYSVKKNLRAKT